LASCIPTTTTTACLLNTGQRRFSEKKGLKHRQQGGRFGGGVLIATKGCIKASPREDVACESELLFIDV